MGESIVQVAVPVPLRRSFDYLCPAALNAPKPGQRVRVVFGGRRLVGVVTRVVADSALPRTRLKPLLEIIDTQPLVPDALIGLIGWAAQYYHHPLGEVWHAALPGPLRDGAPREPAMPFHYRITAAGRMRAEEGFGRAPVQARVMATLSEADVRGVVPAAIESLAASAATIVRRFEAAGWVERCPPPLTQSAAGRTSPTLNPAQQRAAAVVREDLGGFAAHLLYGVTGSGKTEVYLDVIEEVVARRGQALVLIPEIALTPQLVRRFQARFAQPIAVLHSGLSNTQRHRAWWQAGTGGADIVIGTRSAVFTPLARPGLIVVDEEHDLSYKQQEGFRYHARDLAVYRARLEHIPVVLGSATPSLETLANAGGGRYTQTRLETRAKRARLPEVRLIDLRRVPARDGLSKPVVDAVAQSLERGEQSLVFLNRRGFAPVLVCVECGWQAQCPRCDARMITHKTAGRLRCHHCGHDKPAVESCPACGGSALVVLGAGTQRVEEAIEGIFPSAKVVRIDRDNVPRKGDLEARLEEARSGAGDILVGTQLLAKGHDFPRVTLVAVLNADQGLFSVDYRAMEQLSQQVIQVAGRAGRGERPGMVLIQTAYPTHPQFEPLLRHDYSAFAEQALAERKAAHCPPYCFLALLRAESTDPEAALDFVRNAAGQGAALAKRLQGVDVMDPVPSPMEKRAGRYRAQLLLRSSQRGQLHRLLEPLLEGIEDARFARRVRWSIDVDPVSTY